MKKYINNLNLGDGWFLSNNIIIRAGYMSQNYAGSAWAGRFSGTEFDGFNVEAAISF